MLIGYDFCHNESEVIEESKYEQDKDETETGDSIFCYHGAGRTVKWDEVQDYMHLPFVLRGRKVSSLSGDSARDETWRLAENLRAMQSCWRYLRGRTEKFQMEL